MSAEVSAIIAFRLTTAEPERLMRFYQGLGFTLGHAIAIPSDEIAQLGLTQGGTRFPLRFGAQRLDLDKFDHPGRAYPADATSADLCFQHFALVTKDAHGAWASAMALGAAPISSQGPITLPASAGCVTAVKFRDPEGHPLEFLQFPPDAADDLRGTESRGIDHSAISVSDAGASVAFYQALGLAVDGPTLNHGPTQVALDGLADVQVDVVPMIPRRRRPHLELLGYRTPVGRNAGRMEPNDIAATRIVWAADRDGFLRDPDGHLHLLERQGEAVTGQPEPGADA